MVGGIWYEQARLAHGCTSRLVLVPTTALALGPEAAAAQQSGLTGEDPGELRTEGIDAALQSIVEHVAEHQHAALHPLAGAAKLGVVELGRGAITVAYGKQHVGHGILAEVVTLGKIIDNLLAF